MTAPRWLDELRSVPVIRPRRWAELSGTAPSTVYDQLARGILPSIRLGRTIAIPTVPLLRLLGVENEYEYTHDLPAAEGDVRAPSGTEAT